MSARSTPDRPNDKSDPDASFCGYPDNDGGLQPGYSWLFGVDFKTELPFANCFASGRIQDSRSSKMFANAILNWPGSASS